MKELKLLAIKKEDIKKVLKTFNLEIDSKGNIIKEGKPLKCHICETKLNVTNIGHIASGSPALFFCDNPSCVIAYLRNR